MSKRNGGDPTAEEPVFVADEIYQPDLPPPPLDPEVVAKAKANGPKLETPDEFVKAIINAWEEYRALWQKCVAAVVRTSTLLNEAKAKVKHGEWLSMGLQLPFGERKAQMLMQISRSTVISNPQNFAVFPPAWSTLHILAGMPDLHLQKMVDNKEIKPELTAAEVRQLPGMTAHKATQLVTQLMGLAMQHPDPRTLVEYGGNDLVNAIGRHYGATFQQENSWKLADWFYELHLLCWAARDIRIEDGRYFRSPVTGPNGQHLSPEELAEWWLEVERCKLTIKEKFSAKRRAEAGKANGSSSTAEDVH